MHLEFNFPDLASEDPIHDYEPRPKQKKKTKGPKEDKNVKKNHKQELTDVAPWYAVELEVVSDVGMKRMHNHMGKMLPEIPDMDTQLALSAKMIDKRQATPKVFFC